MLYAIKAYESNYGGEHGVVDYAVVDCNSRTIAEDTAKEMAYNLFEDYDLVEEAGFDEEAIGEGYEKDSDEYNSYIQTCIDGSIEYQIWKVKPSQLTLADMDGMFSNTPNEFIEQYCEEI